MKTDVHPMACGGCGNGLFRMFYQGKPDQVLIAECTKCKSQTVITACRPTLDLKWGDTNQLGLLCKMQPTRYDLSN